VIAVAAITIAAAAAGPLYERAAQGSLLTDQLNAASADQTGLHFQTDTDVSGDAGLATAVQSVPKAGTLRGYSTPITGAVTTVSTTAGVRFGSQNAMLVWRDGECAQLVFVSGACPKAAGQVVVSERTVDSGYGWRLGSTLDLGLLESGAPIAGVPPVVVKVVGVYRPLDTAAPFWFGRNYFNAFVGADTSADQVDSIFTVPAEYAQLDQDDTEVDVDFPLDIPALRLSGVAAARREVAALTKQFAGTSGLPSTVTVATGLPGVLDAARHREQQIADDSLLVSLQLGLLALLVLFQIVRDALEARGSEVALAKVRGLTPMATLRFGLAEPLLLLLVAVPIGLLLALAFVHVFADHVLVAGTPVAFTWAPVVGALIALAGAVLAVLLAARRTLTRPVLEQWRRTGTPAASLRAVLAFDIALAAGAAIAVIALYRHQSHPGNPSSLALLSPGLLVLAVGSIGVRLLPLIGRALLPLTRASARLSTFLALRQVTRQPAALGLAGLLAVMLGLATFAVGAESVTSANRTARAQVETGAPQVVSAQFAPGHDPLAAARAADPTGRWAMAVASWLPDGGGSVVGSVLGVDSSRLTAVGYSVRGVTSPATITALITAPTAPTLTIHATQLRVTVAASALSGPAPAVVFNLRAPNRPAIEAYSTALQAGTHDYVANIPCGQVACELTGITWERIGSEVFASIGGTAVLQQLSARQGNAGWTSLSARFTQAGDWVTNNGHTQGHDDLQAGPGGLTDHFDNANGASSVLRYADSPTTVPVIAAPNATSVPAGSPGPLTMVDEFQQQATYAIARTVPVLPAVLTGGMLADLSYLRAYLTGFSAEATWQVWLGPAAPPDALARLQAAGLLVQGSTHTEIQRAKVLSREAPALALSLLLVSAVGGAVLAVGATAVAVAAAGRRRSYDLAALSTIGVRRGVLRRSAVLEQFLLLGTGIVLGIPAGFVAVRVVMSRLPEFSESTPVPLRYLPHISQVAIFAAAFVVLLAVTAWIAGTMTVRAAIPARLREAPQ
jgi:hypothetical protein